MADLVEVTLRLQQGSAAPSGVIIIAGCSRRFRGWLELLRCLEDARTEGTSRAAARVDDT